MCNRVSFLAAVALLVIMGTNVAHGAAVLLSTKEFDPRVTSLQPYVEEQIGSAVVAPAILVTTIEKPNEPPQSYIVQLDISVNGDSRGWALSTATDFEAMAEKAMTAASRSGHMFTIDPERSGEGKFYPAPEREP